MNETPIISIAQALNETAQILRQEAIPDARREAASLLGLVLGKDYTYLLTRAEQMLAPVQLGELREAA